MVSSSYSFSNMTAPNTELSIAWMLNKLGQQLIVLNSPMKNDFNNKQK